MRIKEKKLQNILNKEKTVTVVAEELNVSRQTVHKWLREYKSDLEKETNLTQIEPLVSEGKSVNQEVPTVVDKSKKLRAIINKNKSVTAVAEELNVSRQTIHKWLQKYKTKLSKKELKSSKKNEIFNDKKFSGQVENSTFSYPKIDLNTKPKLVNQSNLKSIFKLPIFKQYGLAIIAGIVLISLIPNKNISPLISSKDFYSKTPKLVEVSHLKLDNLDLGLSKSGILLVGKDLNIPSLNFPKLSVTSIRKNITSFNHDIFVTISNGPWIYKNTLGLNFSFKQNELTNEGRVLGASTLAIENTSLLNRLSLSVFCKVGSLVTKLDTSRCNMVVATPSVDLSIPKARPTVITTNTPAVNNPVITTVISTSTPSSRIVVSKPKTISIKPNLKDNLNYQTQYITKYITLAGPAGPAGPAGMNGLNGKDANQSTGGFGGYIAPVNNYFTSTPQANLVGVSTIGYIRDATIEYSKFNYGTSTNLSLQNANVLNSVFNGNNVFNDQVSFTGDVTINNLTASSSIFTNSTTTNSSITSLVATNATSTNHYVTNLSANDSQFTNSTTTNSFINNLNVINSTTTNFVAVNSSTTNATTSTLYASTLNAISATSTNLFVTNVSITNATTTNSFLNNATSTNHYIANLSANDSQFVNATSTNLYTNLLNAVSATSTNFFSTKSFLTNATSTNYYITNLTADDSQFTNATTSKLYANSLNAVSATTTNQYITNLTADDSLFTRATSTDFFATNSQFINSIFANSTTTNSSISSLLVTKATSTNHYIANLSANDSQFVNATSTNLYTNLLNAVSATSTNFFSTNSFLTNATTTNLTGTNSLFSNGTTTNFFTTNLAVGNVNTSGSQTINGTLSVVGTTTLGSNTAIEGSVTLGTSTSNLITVNGLINSNLIPAANISYDLGTPSLYWRNVYAGTVTANSFSAASTSIAGTNSTTFSINSSNGSTDAQDSSLIFFRGLVTPNAIIRWNSLTKRLESNMSFHVQNETPSTGTTTFSVQGGQGQGSTNLFELKNNSGTLLSSFNANGGLEVGQNISATGTLNVNGATNLSTLFVNATSTLATTTVIGTLTVNGNTNITQGGILTVGDKVIAPGEIGAGTSSPSGKIAIQSTHTDQVAFLIYGTSTQTAPLISVFDYPGSNQNIFQVSATGTLLTKDIFATSATISGNLEVTGHTNLINASTTNLTVTGILYAPNLSSSNVLFNNATTTNLFVTSATTTNLFSTNSTSTLFSAITASTTNLTVMNATLTNASTTNLSANGFSGSNGIFTGTFNVNGLTTLGNASTTNLSAVGATLASLFSTNATFTNASTTNLSATGATLTSLFSTNATLINASTTNLSVASTTYFANNTGIWNASGNVGIGTTTPTAKLNVEATSGNILDLTNSGVSKFRVASNGAFTAGYDSVVNGNLTTYRVGTLDGIAADTRLGAYSGYNIIFGAGSSGTEFARITSIGNVGIGTTSPSAKLDIWGNLNVGTSSTPTLFANTGTGRVGIGTTAPSEKLTLPYASKIGWTYSSSDGNVYHTIGKSADGAGPLEFVNKWTSGATNKIYSFYGGSAGTTELVTILNGGNVGIGTTTPGSLLSVNGNSYFAGNIYATGTLNILGNTTLANVTLTNASTTAISGGGLNFTSGFFTNLTATSASTTNLTVSSTTYFANNTGIWNTSGSVGIGTTAPINPLDIVGADSQYVGISYKKSIANSKSMLAIYDSPDVNNSDYILFGVDPSGSNIGYASGGVFMSTGKNGSGTARDLILHNYDSKNIIFATANAEKVRITSTGNVGIGTTGPIQKLDVNGTVGINGTQIVDASRNLTNIGTISSGAITSGLINGQTISSSANFTGTATFNSTLTQTGGYANLGGYNAGLVYPSFGGSVSIAQNFSNGNAESDIWNTLNPSTYTNTGLRFLQQTGASSYRDLMFLKQDGSVGLGTTGPGTQLHVLGAGSVNSDYVNGQASGATLYLQDSAGSSGNGGQIVFGASQGIFAGIKGFIVNGTGPAGDLIFQTRNTTGNVLERMRIGSTGVITTTGTINGQTISSAANFTGTVGVAGTLTLSGATPQISLANGTSNWIAFNSAGVAAPTFNSSSAGTKIILYPNAGASASDFALGIESGTLWSSVPQTGNQFKWYGGVTQAMTLSGTGNLTLGSAGAGTLTSGLINGQTISSAANFTGTVTSAGLLQVNGGAGNYQLRLSEGTGALYFNLGRESSDGSFRIQGNQVGANNIILAPSSGNVGIGVVPTQKLDVNGTIGINGTQIVDASRNLTNIGTISSGAITSGLINGQTISSAANFTGSLTTAGLVNVSGGVEKLGEVLTHVVGSTLLATNWYRVATLSSTNQAMNVKLQLHNSSRHTDTIINIDKGTGFYNAEVYEGGRYVYSQRIKYVRVIDSGVNNVINIDVQVGADETAGTYTVISDYKSSNGGQLTLVDFTDQGTGATGNVYPVWGVTRSYGTGVSAGPFFSMMEDGKVGIGTTGPGKLLDVNGTFNATGAATFASTVNINGAGNPGNFGVLGGGTQATTLATARSLAVTSVQTLNTSGWLLTTFMAGGNPSMQVVDQAGTSAGNLDLMPYGGNVGIGTTVPDQLLTINGAGGIGFKSATMNSYDKKIYSPADGDLEWMTNNGAAVHGFAVSNQGTKAVYLNTSGNSYFNGGSVGIGTVSPSNTLHVVSGAVNTTGDSLTTATAQVTGPNVLGSTSNGTFVVATNDAPAIDVGGSIGFAGRYTGTQQFTAAQIRGAKEDGVSGNFGGYLAFGTRAHGTQISEKVRISGAGNVGINITAPTEKLDVNGMIRIAPSDQTGVLAFGNRTQGAGYYDNGIYRGSIGSLSAGNILNVSSYEGIAFNATAAAFGSQSTRMYIRGSDGNVGIGTTAPVQKLDVAGSINIAAGYDLMQQNATVLRLSDNVNTVINPPSGSGNTYINWDRATTNTIFFENSSNKISGGGNWDMSGNLHVGPTYSDRKFDVASGNSDGVTIGQDTDNSSTIQSYIDAQWAARVTYAGGCCNLLKINPDVGSVQIGSATNPTPGLSVYGILNTYNTATQGVNQALQLKSKFSAYGHGPYMSFDIFDVNSSSDNNEIGRIGGVFTDGGNGSIVNGALTFSTGLSGAMNERMRIDKNGNVGIGASSPGEKLEIYGANGGGDIGIRFHESGIVEYKMGIDDTTDNLYITNNNGATGIGANATGIVMNSAGNVGVGITPLTKLHVLNSATSGNTTPQTGTTLDLQSSTSNYLSFINTADNGTNAGVVMTDNNTGGYMVFHNYDGGAMSDSMVYGSYQDHIFQTGASDTITGKTEVMRIKQNGNVGIGTTNPNYPLTVSSASNSVLGITSSSVGGTLFNITNTSTGGNGWDLASSGSSNAYGAGHLAINVGGVPQVVIKSNGNFGIGITTPADKLDVNGNIHASSIYFGNSTAYTTMGISNDFGSNVGLTLSEGSSYLRVVSAGNTAEHLRISSAGNVGIGATNPTYKLDVSGNIRTTGTIYANANGASYLCGGDDACLNDINVANTVGVHGVQNNGWGDINAAAFNIQSSRRFKTNIRNSRYGLNAVTSLQGVDFSYIDPNASQDATGFIAEDVSNVFPYAVQYDNNGLALSVDYSKFAPLFVNAIKEQQGQIISASSSLSLLSTLVLDNQLSTASSTSNIITLLNNSTTTLNTQISHITDRLNLTNGKLNTMTFTGDGTVGIGNDGTSLSGELLRVSGRIRATGFDIDGAADIAENFQASEAVDAGTIVAFSTSTTNWSVNASSTYQMSTIRKSASGYEAIGIVSTTPGIRLGGNVNNGIPVAFTGRVPVKVTNENGEIKQGDYITVSNTRPGYGMKLTGEGRAIGIAISDYTNQDTVLILLQIGNHNLDLNGHTATTTGMLTTGNLNLNANGVAIYNIKSLASANGTWSIDENGRIVGKEIAIERLCVGTVCVTETQFLNMVQQTNPGMIPTPQPEVAGTSTTEVASSSQPVADSNALTSLEPSSSQSVATTTDPVIPPSDPVIPIVADPTPPVTDTTPAVDTTPAI